MGITRENHSTYSLSDPEVGPMFVRRGPAIVLSVLSAAALVIAPVAVASDGGTAKDVDQCDKSSTYKLKVTTDADDRLEVTGIVYSNDDDIWDWKLKHNDDVSAKGDVKSNGDGDKSFKIVRTMVNLTGPDVIGFRAENQNTGEVCRGEVNY